MRVSLFRVPPVLGIRQASKGIRSIWSLGPTAQSSINLQSLILDALIKYSVNRMLQCFVLMNLRKRVLGTARLLSLLLLHVVLICVYHPFHLWQCFLYTIQFVEQTHKDTHEQNVSYTLMNSSSVDSHCGKPKPVEVVVNTPPLL